MRTRACDYGACREQRERVARSSCDVIIAVFGSVIDVRGGVDDYDDVDDEEHHSY